MDLLAHLNASSGFTALAVMMALFTLPLWVLTACKAYFSGHKSLIRPLSVVAFDAYIVIANFWEVYVFAGHNVMATILVLFAVYCCLIYSFASPTSPPAPADAMA